MEKATEKVTKKATGNELMSYSEMNEALRAVKVEGRSLNATIRNISAICGGSATDEINAVAKMFHITSNISAKKITEIRGAIIAAMPLVTVNEGGATVPAATRNIYDDNKKVVAVKVAAISWLAGLRAAVNLQRKKKEYSQKRVIIGEYTWDEFSSGKHLA